MSRDTVASVTSAAAQNQFVYALLVEINSLTGGTLRACTGGRFVNTGTNSYSPIGNLGGMDAVQEDSDPFPRAVRLWLSAANTTQIQNVVTENLFNRPVSIYRCFLNDQGYTVVGTPQLLWKGKTNTTKMVTNDPQRGNYYEVECESRLKRTSRAQYFDLETHQQILGNSGDTFFGYVPLIPLRVAPWGLLPYGVGGFPPVRQPSNPTPVNLPPGLGGPVASGPGKLPWQS